jgi:hypothetical protein
MDYDSLIPHLGAYMNSIDWNLVYKYCSVKTDNVISQNNANNYAQKQNKLTCRY